VDDAVRQAALAHRQPVPHNLYTKFNDEQFDYLLEQIKQT
jgi:hypothetical protein